MVRRPPRLLAAMALTCPLLLAAPSTNLAQVQPDEAAAAAAEPQGWGFYFGISLARLRQAGQAAAVGTVIDAPAVPGTPVQVVGPSFDADFGGRFDLGLRMGYRLPKNRGTIEASYFQWDPRQDLRREAEDGKRFANTLASPRAGFHEDLGQSFNAGGALASGPPDGRVEGYHAGTVAGAPNRTLNGAEDWNFNGTADFIRFDTSNQVVGTMSTRLRMFDLDYVRDIRVGERLTLAGRYGLRIADLAQVMDMAYRDVGAFAVYTDDEGNIGSAETPCTGTPGQVVDGDGSGEATVASNERDGDGFMDGSCNRVVRDRLSSVETISEDRIIARIGTRGVGVRAGLEARYAIGSRWSFVGGLGLGAMRTDVRFRYRETFVSERDRFLNFIDWDFNGDGRYDNFDLDFDGSCTEQGLTASQCEPDERDHNWVQDNMGGRVPIRQRAGARFAVVGPALGSPCPRGVLCGAFDGANQGWLRLGDPVPRSERNRDVLRQVSLINDVGGQSADIRPMVDLHLGMEYQFSRFARLNFGMRSMRWFKAGNFRDLSNDVLAERPVEGHGDFALDGYYVMLTMVPR